MEQAQRGPRRARGSISHNRVGKEAVQIIENPAYLKKLPVNRFTFLGFPLSIRAVAVVEG